MDWSIWRPFPDPREGEFLIAPLGPGCYELRRAETRQLVLFGVGGHVAKRMTSLLPKPFGSGTRNNDDKRAYCLKHLHDIEYRTRGCATRDEAKAFEDTLKKAAADYVFGT